MRNSTLPKILAAALLAFCCAAAHADVPIYLQEPYDEITLDAANENKVLKVEPLKMSPKEIAAKIKTRGKLIVHPKDAPDKTLEIASWHSVVKVVTFAELILNKGIELSEDGNFDEAFDYFTFLQRKMPRTPGLAEAIDNSLQAEVVRANENKQYDAALALLRKLHRRNPEFPKIENALGKMTDGLVGQYVEKKDYASARVLLYGLAADYPKNAVVARWRARLEGESAPLLAKARAAADAGRWSEAGDLCRRIAVVWPDLPGARELALKVSRKFPRIVVGVGSLAADFTPARLNDWPSRRDSRLIYRTLEEFTGPSAEGGNYVCPVGEITSQDLGRRLSIKLKPGIRWATGKAALCNSDVASRLLEMAVDGNPGYRLDWSDLIESVSISGVYGVNIDLRRAHVRPEAMLQIVLTPLDYRPVAGKPLPTNGPLLIKSQSPRETVFTANSQYFAAEAGQPMEIVERKYDTVAQAVRALKRGDIDVLDRVDPWTLSELRQAKGVIVQPYALPLVHCLVPNLSHPLLADRTFRRALSYGIQPQGDPRPDARRRRRFPAAWSPAARSP